MLNSLITSVGCSTIQDAKIAGKEAAEEALRGGTDFPHRLAIVFASSCFHQVSLIESISATLGKTCPIIGSSTSGEICPVGPLTHSCVVVLLASNAAAVPWTTNTLSGLDSDPRQTASLWVRKLTSGIPMTNRSACMVIGDGLCSSYSAVHSGLRESLGQSAAIMGYLAGDDCQFKKTFVYDSASAYTAALSGCLFLKPLRIGVGFAHGFSAISKPRKITSANTDRIDTIDKKNAASVLVEYFGKDALLSMHKEHLSRQSLAFPLGIQDSQSSDWTMRYINKIHKNGSVQCNAEVPTNRWMQLMVGNRSELLASAQQAAAQALEASPMPKCLLIFSSYIRKQLLGPAYAEDELDVVRRMAPHVPLAGCYSYGEINPDSLAETSDAPLNQCGSIQIIAIGEG